VKFIQRVERVYTKKFFTTNKIFFWLENTFFKKSGRLIEKLNAHIENSSLIFFQIWQGKMKIILLSGINIVELTIGDKMVSILCDKS